MPSIDPTNVFSRYDLRGIYGQEINGPVAGGIARAIGKVAPETDVILGNDQRSLSQQIKPYVITGLKQAGKKVITPAASNGIDGLATTDMVAAEAKRTPDTFGVELSPSHMDPNWVGLKPLTGDGRLFHNEEMNAVETAYWEDQTKPQPEAQAPIQYNGLAEYKGTLQNLYEERFEASLSDLDIIVDARKAVGNMALPNLLTHYGADVKTINDAYNADGNWDYEPKSGNISELENLVQESADLGLALDGDADRLVAVNDAGNTVDGSALLALLGRDYVCNGAESITCSVNTASYVSDVIDDAGGTVHWEPVGAIFTALGCQAEGLPFGGQPNGHMMDLALTPYDSGTLAGLLLSGYISENGASLASLQDSLPDWYERQANISTDAGHRVVGQSLQDSLEKRGYSIVSTKDGVKATNDTGEIIVRPSGTEPVLRVRTGSQRESDAEDIMAQIKDLLEEKLQSHYS